MESCYALSRECLRYVLHPIWFAGVCCRSCCELTVGRHSRQEVLFTVTIASYSIAVLVMLFSFQTYIPLHLLLRCALSCAAACLQACASTLSMRTTYNGTSSKRTGISSLRRTRTGNMLRYAL